MAALSDPPAGTRVIRVDPVRPDPAAIREAAACLRDGGLVAFPTETVYGLGADATSSPAVAAVFRVKARPPDNPLIVHVASPAEVPRLASEVPETALALMRAFWPGPLTLILPRSALVVPEVSCGLGTVAVRMPDHAVALELIRQAGVPVAAPSANLSGRPSPTRAEHVLTDLGGRIDFVLDAGRCPVGVESTVLDLTAPVPTVLRPGGVTLEALRRVVSEVAGPGPQPAPAPGLGPPPAAPAPSPGLRHRHYAPRTRLVVLLPGEASPKSEALAAALAAEARREASAGRRVGVAATAETATVVRQLVPEAVVVTWGSRDRAEEVAAALFAALRDLDRLGLDVIVAEGLAPTGLGLAVNDRLVRAAVRVVESPVAGPEPAGDRETILVVCAGNTCRSPMGAAVLDKLLSSAGGERSFRVESAGVQAVDGLGTTPEAAAVMKERGFDLGLHRSRRLTREMAARARLILTMTREQKEAVVALCPEAADRVWTLKRFAAGEREEDEDIPDPLPAGSREAYQAAAEEIERAARLAAERLLRPPDLAGLTGGDAVGAPGGPDDPKGAPR